MIYGIHGRPRSGKTLFITACLFYHYCWGRKIQSNYNLYFPSKNELIENGFAKVLLTQYSYDIEETMLHKPKLLDFQYIIDNMPDSANELEDTTLGFDELHIWMDARRSMDKDNLFLSYLLSQSGKHDTDIYYSSQQLAQVDRRVDENSNYDIFCARIPDYQYDPLKGISVITRDNYSREIIKQFVWRNFYQFFDMFDTKQIIWNPKINQTKEQKALSKDHEMKELIRMIKSELSD